MQNALIGAAAGLQHWPTVPRGGPREIHVGAPDVGRVMPGWSGRLRSGMGLPGSRAWQPDPAVTVLGGVRNPAPRECYRWQWQTAWMAITRMLGHAGSVRASGDAIVIAGQSAAHVQDNHAAVEPEPCRISVADNVDAHYVVYKSRGRLYGHQDCEGRVAPVAGSFALTTWPRCIPGLPPACRLHRSAADDQGGGRGLTLQRQRGCPACR